LLFSYVGHTDAVRKISARSGSVLNISLARQSETEQIGTITIVNDKSEDNVKKNQLGIADLSPDIISASPAVNGKGDVINAVQMLPGVQAGLGGTPGYYVRGGNADQNLIQLDEAILYNPSHLFGLVSIFNTEAIKNARFIKSGIPASYGDHLSSVLDISMKDGNNKQPGGNLQLGTVASGVTLQGPVVRNKASFILSARRSTIDLLLKPLHIKNYFNDYYFYDVNGKLNVQLSSKNRIFLSLYDGLDKGLYKTGSNTADSAGNNQIKYGVNFGNRAITFRWNHFFSKKLFSNTSLIWSNYHQSLSAAQQEYYAQLYSGIRNLNFKTDLHYYPGLDHRVMAGINYLYQTLLPASVSDKIPPSGSITNIKPGDIPKKNTNRIAFYLSDDITFSKKFSSYIGTRFPVFYKPGIYYFNIEPRLSFRYLINPATSIKIAGTQIHQYLHLVQSYNASFPAEIWIGSSRAVKPQRSRQVSAGVFKNFKENKFQSSLEVYYKFMDNQLLFKGGTNPAIDKNIEESLIFGKGRSYGADFFVRKNKGKLTGWLGYSLSYSYQQFDSLNFGQKFQAAHNRRHSVYLSASYQINQHWKISSNLFIASGNSITLSNHSPAASNNQNNNPLYDEDNNNGNSNNGSFLDQEPNNYRLTPYNRADLSIVYEKSGKIAGKIFETEWIFSVYNVYARSNTLFAYRAIDPVSGIPFVKEVSFIPIIPCIIYSLRF
ncbi:MAG TPA: hypothetical protein VIV35_08205, partial [Chitinophagaceae bacterium]